MKIYLLFFSLLFPGSQVQLAPPHKAPISNSRSVCCHCQGKGRWYHSTMGADNTLTTIETLCPTCGGSGYGSCEPASGTKPPVPEPPGQTPWSFYQNLIDKVENNTAESLRKLPYSTKPKVKKYRNVACKHFVACNHWLPCQHPIPCQHYIPCQHVCQSPLLTKPCHPYDCAHINHGFMHPNDGRAHLNHGTQHPHDVEEFWE